MMLTHCGNNVRNRYSGCVFSVKDIVPVPLKTSRNLFITGEAVRKAASELKRRIESGEIFPTVTCENRLDRSSLGFAVQGIEVEVDEVTGKVVVTKAVQAVDLGKAVNPSICRGQVEGGIAMGVGYTLFEELTVGVNGSILNPTFRTYRIPAAADIPPMEVHLVESNDPDGPMGAKCVGEICINPVAPAIANAIADAVGIRFTILPLTPERVWEALAKRKENSG